MANKRSLDGRQNPELDFGRSIKIITQGNENVGKRDLLLAYTNPNYPEEYELLHEFDPYLFTHSTIVNKQQRKFQLELYDSTGLEEHYNVRKIFYRKTDVVLLLYSVVDRQSFHDIGNIWYPEIIDNCPDAIVILVATEISRRRDPAAIAEFFVKKQRPISSEEGESLAQKIGAHRYFEVCVTGHDGIWEVFDVAVREVLKAASSPIREIGLYPFFCKHASVEELELFASKKYNVNLIVGEVRSSFSCALQAKNYPFAKRILEYENGVANMANSELESIPEIIFEWINQGLIKEINLDNNLLNAIPLELVALKNVSLNDNPLLSIPIEFRTAKWKRIKQYLESVAEKTANWNIRKLILVGEEGVGKTTVAKCISTKAGKVDTTVNLSTDGIDIQEIRIRKEKGGEKEYIFNTWDFGGQVVFYPTHQFFLSTGAIYLIVFDMSNYKHQRIEYWMKQLKQMNGEASVIIMVGTHADACREEEIAAITERIQLAFPKRLFPSFQNIIIPVSCKTGAGMKQLKEALVQLAEHPSLCSLVSEAWVMLYELIKNHLESGMDYTDRETFYSWMESCGIPLYQMGLIIEFLMRTGSILNFHDKLDKNLKDLVVLNPQWLARVMACLITMKGNFVTEGYIYGEDMRKIFSQYPGEIQAHVISLLEKFKIIYPLTQRGSSKYLVPSLLPTTRPSAELLKVYPSKLLPSHACFGRLFHFGQLPLGLIGRLTISLLRLPSAVGELFWRNGLLLNFGHSNQILMEYNPDEYLLEFQSRFLLPHKQFAIGIWRSVLETVKTLIESFYPRLAEMKVEHIPCIHCIKCGVYKEKVYMFSYQEVDEAAREGRHILYCNNIQSPYRSVFLADLAPDLGLFDIPHITEDSITIEKVLGEGGFGKVYKGLLRELPVAIKELKLSKNAEANRSKFQEFQTECYMMNLLRHPNIIALYGVLVNPPRMVLQLVTGGDLFQYMHKEQADHSLVSIAQEDFPWRKRYAIAMDIAKGLHYLQSLTPPVVHRDLRSPNIFMTHDGTALIGDFGLARLVQSGEIGGLLGTWQWVSPEAMNSSSESYDQRSDIYSFGIVLWELAAIATPFEEYITDPRFFINGTFKTMEMKQAITDGLRPSIPSSTPQPFAQLITQCWQCDPELRPSTAHILEVLSNLSGEAIDELIERPKVVLPQNIFVSLQEAEKHLTKSDVTPHPVVLMQIDLNSREKFSCLLVLHDMVWVASNLGSLCVFQFHPEEGYILVARKKRQKKRISQLIHVSNEVWSISDDGTVNCWNVKSFALEFEWMPHGEDANAAATTTLLFPSNALKRQQEFINVEQQVWFVSPLEGRITAWRASTKEYIKTITHEDLLGAMIMEFHKGYVWVACGASGNKICMYDAVTLDHIGSFVAHDSRITSILSIENRIWTSSIEDIRVWDAVSIDTLSVFKTSKVQNSKVECMVHRGNRVFAGSFDGTVFSFDVQTVTALQELMTADSVRMIGLFENSEMFITMSQFHLTIWPTCSDLYATPKNETIHNSLNFENLPEPYREEALGNISNTNTTWKRGSKGSMARTLPKRI